MNSNSKLAKKKTRFEAQSCDPSSLKERQSVLKVNEELDRDGMRISLSSVSLAALASVQSS